jgi:phosphate starvation-inducible PhoH-like protein
LKRVEGLTFVHFDEADVVRHHLVQRIIRAYDEHKTHIAEQQMLLLSGGKSAEAAGGGLKSSEVKNPEAKDLNGRTREASGE